MPRVQHDYEMPTVIKWLSTVLALALGAGYAFGPDSVSSAPIFEFAKALMPIQLWGIVFMGCGFLLASTRFLGYAACGTTWLLWEIFLVLGAANGNLQSWGSVIWPVFFVGINFMHIIQWGQTRKALVRSENITEYWAARRRSREEDR